MASSNGGVKEELDLDYELDAVEEAEDDEMLKMLKDVFTKQIREIMATKTAKTAQQIQTTASDADRRRSASVVSGGVTEPCTSSVETGCSRVRAGGEILDYFDPDDKDCNVVRWLNKIEQLGRIHDWSEYEKAYFMQTKLQGAARRWYNQLDSYECSWEQWKTRLEKAFPRQPDYAESLMEMMARKKLDDETMTNYYYDKMGLITRCEMSGTKALSLLIYGLPKALQGSARAFNCTQCEDLYAGFLAGFDKFEHGSSSLKRKYTGGKHVPSKMARRVPSQQASATAGMSGVGGGDKKTIRCYNCQQFGQHISKDCPKPRTTRCMVCGGSGHTRKECRLRCSS